MRNVMIPYQITVMVLATFAPLILVWGQEGSADKPQVVVEVSSASQDAVAAEESDTGADEEKNESLLLSKTRQLTFEGRRAGEGYFSADGSRMVFQSERDAANPFYQIYVTDLETGDIEKVSPGYGKTTCAWIHPSGERVLFASTQHDTEARSKQKQELELRES